MPPADPHARGIKLNIIYYIGQIHALYQEKRAPGQKQLIKYFITPLWTEESNPLITGRLGRFQYIEKGNQGLKIINN
jgi:hypothetical protein